MERDMSGDLLIRQGDLTLNVHVNEDRNLGTLLVAASYDGTSGTGDGVIRGDECVFTVDWHNGTKGRYEGHFGLDNVLSGHGFDLEHPTSQANWFVYGRTFPKS